MPSVIEHSDNKDNADVVVVGSEHAPISLKLYQDMYHQITGRSEKASQKHNENLRLEFSDIEQLHHKIMQICDVHEVIASNELITVFHEKERKEQFTSFERFKLYNSNTTQHTVSVVVKYNFSIVLSGLNKPQEYVITIRLNSKLAVLNSLEQEVPAFMRGKFFNVVGFNAAEISVEYIDFIVARSFMQAFKEWVDGCNHKENNKFLDCLKSYSHTFHISLKIIMAFAFSYLSVKAVADKGNVLNINEWLQFLILTGTSFYILIMLSGVIGKIIENAVDSVHSISYLKINKGDNKLVDGFHARNKKTFWKSLGACCVTVILGVIASKVAYLI